MNSDQIKQIRRISWFVMIIIFFLLLFFGNDKRFTVRLNDEQLILSYANEEPVIVKFEDIISVVKLADVHLGEHISGKETKRYKFGVWNNSEYGAYHLCIDVDVNRFILLETANGFVLFNFESDDATDNFYKAFIELHENRQTR